MRPRRERDDRPGWTSSDTYNNHMEVPEIWRLVRLEAFLGCLHVRRSRQGAAQILNLPRSRPHPEWKVAVNRTEPPSLRISLLRLATRAATICLAFINRIKVARCTVDRTSTNFIRARSTSCHTFIPQPIDVIFYITDGQTSVAATVLVTSLSMLGTMYHNEW